MKHLATILLVLLGSLTLFSQVQSPDFKKKIDSYISYSVPTISVEELKDETSKYLILDARERKEFETSHICDAQFLGYKDPDFSMLKNVDKSKPIVVYCSIGYRSEKIGERLLENGFTNVYNLYGSIFEWVNQDQPVYSLDKNETKKVHTYNRKWSKWMTNSKLEKVY